MTENLNETLLGKADEQKYDTTIFSKIKSSFQRGQQVFVKDDELKQFTPGVITYVGQRFCTVQLEKGHSVSVNYASMIDKNNKEVHSTTVKQ